MNLKYTYMSGAGNLFTVIDNREFNFNKIQLSKLAPKLCNIPNGIKTEGLLVLEDSMNKHDFSCLFFNPDGSTSMMCGNGARCITQFAALSGLINKSENRIFKFEMAGNLYESEFIDKNICIYFPKPIEIKKNIQIKTKFGLITGDFINNNTDHFIINFDEYNFNSLNFFELDINKIASEIRYNSIFSPNGTNVNFYMLIDNNSLYLRTYERGVEAETGACGTGSIATALSVVLSQKAEFPIKIIPTSKEFLIIDKTGNFPENYENIKLIGGAKVLSEGEIEIEV